MLKVLSPLGTSLKSLLVQVTPRKYSLLGGLKPNANVNPITLLHGYESIPELQNASESVRKIFSLEFARKQERNKHELAKIIEKYRVKYGLEEGNIACPEMEVVILTFKVKNLTGVLMNNRKDFPVKNRLVKMAQRRRKMLVKLKLFEPWKYHSLLSDLQLRPPVMYPRHTYKAHYGKHSRKKKKK